MVTSTVDVDETYSECEGFVEKCWVVRRNGGKRWRGVAVGGGSRSRRRNEKDVVCENEKARARPPPVMMYSSGSDKQTKRIGGWGMIPPDECSTGFSFSSSRNQSESTGDYLMNTVSWQEEGRDCMARRGGGVMWRLGGVGRCDTCVERRKIDGCTGKP